MDANACGVFATVIPVLLLAGYFSGQMTALAIADKTSAILICGWGFFVSFAEIAALWGVYRGGLPDSWAPWVVGTTISAALAVPTAGVSRVVQARRPKRDHQHYRPEADRDADDQ